MSNLIQTKLEALYLAGEREITMVQAKKSQLTQEKSNTKTPNQKNAPRNPPLKPSLFKVNYPFHIL